MADQHASEKGAHASMALRMRHHWAPRGHCSYPCCLHDVESDDEVSGWWVFRQLLAGVEDGEVVTISVHRSGNVDRERHYQLVRPHEYELVSGDSPERALAMTCTAPEQEAQP